MPEAAAASSLDGYLGLLRKWSAVHNLTGGGTGDGLRGLANDCEPLVRAASSTEGPACDVGSGAGMPGVMVAIDRPGRKVSLVESEGSKAAFLEQARIELGLRNVEVVHSRVEDWRPDAPPALICARGFASLSALAAACDALVRAGTRMLALKPRDPAGEIEDLRRDHPRWEVRECMRLDGSPSRFMVDAEASR